MINPPERFETDRLLLRPPTTADAEAIFKAYAQDPEVARYMTWRPHKNISETELFVSGCVEAWKGDSSFPYFIVLKSESGVIGVVEMRVANFKVEIGYVLSRKHWGKGIIPEAARALVDWGLSQPQIYRVWAVCDIENAASARVLEKLGMQREGILRRYIMHPNISDAPRDCYCYAVVK